MINLNFEDTRDIECPAKLTEKLSYQDLVDSQNQYISVQYNEINLGDTGYGFDQAFEANEANLYFERMRELSEQTLRGIEEGVDYTLHFHRTIVSGNIKRIFDSVDPKIAKANPLIFHFALDPTNKNRADRKKNIRNPRVYFMVGRNGMIHILFFDPYHEINP